jgi:DNA-binding NtrC family response regulator
MIAESAAMQPVLRLMERVGPSDANVLVTGEHGTGKELVARWLHAASRARRQAARRGQHGRALRGRVRERAVRPREGRLHRREGRPRGPLRARRRRHALPRRDRQHVAGQQAKLLRVLQSGEMERVGSSRRGAWTCAWCRATNADLRADVAAGRFREDLLYRLNTVEIQLPPLRDAPRGRAAARRALPVAPRARYRKALHGFAPDALQRCSPHPWPGNVRELDHASSARC